MKNLIKTKRKQRNLKTRELAQLLGIDQSLVSKFESGQRLPTRQQVDALSFHLEIDSNELLAQWLKEKLILEISDNSIVTRALELVQEERQLYTNRSELASFKKELIAIDKL
jgi:transcriptional regulator with XRE-family HTH domain